MVARLPRFVSRRLMLLFAIALLAAVPLHRAEAQVWNEQGDAGDLPGTSQVTVGNGGLTTINGNLANPLDVDMYCLDLNFVGASAICLQCVVIQGPDVWLFDAAGNGVAATTTCQSGCKQIITTVPPGTYYVAVSYDGMLPQSPNGPIWNFSNQPQHAPDGPGAPGPVVAWAGSPNVQPVNPYQLQLQNFSYCAAPVPAHGTTWGRVMTIYR
jgi:hypothetical protein